MASYLMFSSCQQLYPQHRTIHLFRYLFTSQWHIESYTIFRCLNCLSTQPGLVIGTPFDITSDALPSHIARQYLLRLFLSSIAIWMHCAVYLFFAISTIPEVTLSNRWVTWIFSFLQRAAMRENKFFYIQVPPCTVNPAGLLRTAMFQFSQIIKSCRTFLPVSYAIQLGLSFCINLSRRSCDTSNLSPFYNRQLRLLINVPSGFETKICFFLSRICADTQPMGDFFRNLSNLYPYSQDSIGNSYILFDLCVQKSLTPNCLSLALIFN